jgi:L-amino acid N-acyltransferase YncA
MTATDASVTVRGATETDADAIAAIYNQGIAERTATFDTDECSAASIALARRYGFREVGVYERHGRLDGRWMDLLIVERLLSAAA